LQNLFCFDELQYTGLFAYEDNSRRRISCSKVEASLTECLEKRWTETEMVQFQVCPRILPWRQKESQGRFPYEN